jgi:hypothetical protein
MYHHNVTLMLTKAASSRSSHCERWYKMSGYGTLPKHGSSPPQSSFFPKTILNEECNHAITELPPVPASTNILNDL